MSAFNPIPLIVKKREGQRFGSDEIAALVRAYVRGDVPDYQMSAWLMAVVWRGMNANETAALTRALVESGQVLKLRGLKGPKIDKHSTGGVGDKVSLCVAPLVAACGVAVPMISGRGLGHTGGTLDKLEAIAGYKTDLSPAQFERVVRKVGCSITGQTAELVPADARLYALRDVTGTVESVPLIVASILSKKVAAGLDGLVLDVKTGRGAFMQSLPEARALARALVTAGREGGLRVRALITDMDSPIGVMLGNALEVREAIDVLFGAGPEDTVELTLELGAEMLLLGNAVSSRMEGRRRIEQAISDGSGLERFQRMIEAHGGDPRALEDPKRLPRAPRKVEIQAREGGFIDRVDALVLGQLAVELGAGRTRKEQAVDPAVGIELCVQRGQRVERGDPLALLHVRAVKGRKPWVERARSAFRIARKAPDLEPRVLSRLGR